MGVNSVIMSLWKVNDQATRDFMVFFVNEWLKSKNKYAAFRKAQLHLKGKYNFPYYWGAFVLIGN